MVTQGHLCLCWSHVWSSRVPGYVHPSIRALSRPPMSLPEVYVLVDLLMASRLSLSETVTGPRRNLPEMQVFVVRFFSFSPLVEQINTVT